MQQQGSLYQPNRWVPVAMRGAAETALSRQVVIGMFLVVALIAFEVFNFDTTQYALRSLLGDVRFLGLAWATILAFAFCAIDFAGLAHLFTPQRGRGEPREVWYLMGAWLLGATMNALMTWWAINLTLLNHQFGNEVLSRDQLLHVVPIFVAVLVWLTRILFIGAFSVMGDHLFRQPAAGERAPALADRPYAPATAAGPRRSAEPLSIRRSARWQAADTLIVDDDAPAEAPVAPEPDAHRPARPVVGGGAGGGRRPAMPPVPRRVPMPAGVRAAPGPRR